MALKTRPQFYNLQCNINTHEITKSSRLVSNYTGLHVQANKAIVGQNAFAHEAGIHQDGVLKQSSTYEIMTPESVGLSQSRLVLGKHSGRHALRVRLSELGYTLAGDALNQVFTRFKILADAKKNITDADLVALMADEFHGPEEIFSLGDVQVSCGTMGMPTATVKLVDNQGNSYIHASVGAGPVDAAYQAIDAIIKAPNTLVEYSVHSVTEGIDALGEVTVRIKSDDASDEKRYFGGYGADSDIVVSSVKAYIAAVNRMIIALGYGENNPEGQVATVSVAETSEN